MKGKYSYHVIDRKEWRKYRQKVAPPVAINLTNEQLQRLVSLNDHLTLEDANDIYQPLSQLIAIYFKKYQRLMEDRNQFLGISDTVPPFIIAVSGSVAVGKSTTARLLKVFLSQCFPALRVELMTTDGFLFPNKQLETLGIMNRKGFPESYDMTELKAFMRDVKTNMPYLKIPQYSHDIADRVKESLEIPLPEILIVEGINVLQIMGPDQFFIGEYADLSIYVDAETSLIEKWYMERYALLREYALREPERYHQVSAGMSYEQAMAHAKKTWKEVNLVNLEEYILPTRDRADIVIHKCKKHFIDSIWMRRY